MKSNYFIMTVRNKYVNRQTKFTVENGVCVLRSFELYPNQYIMHEKMEMTKDKFKERIRSELAYHMSGEAGADVYFNGDNYRKFVNE